MGFKCLNNDQIIYSFELDSDSFTVLKTNYKTLDLKMPCCDTMAIPKKNSLGTQFFAHKSGSECSGSNGEGVEHQFCKYLISRTLHGLGWQVELEKRGLTPNGEVWIADIYATRGKAKIAIEVQWSPQDANETCRRTEKYKQSGVRVVWLLRAKRINDIEILTRDFYPLTRHLPIFPFHHDHSSKCMHVGGVSLSENCQQSIPVKPVTFELTDFITRLFTQRIIFSDNPKHQYALNISLHRSTCWRCKKPTTIVDGIHYAIKAEEQYINIGSLDIEDALPEHIDVINRQLSAIYRFGQLKSRYSKTRQTQYMSNGCIHCDSLQGAFFRFTQNNQDSFASVQYINIPWHPSYFFHGKWYAIN